MGVVARELLRCGSSGLRKAGATIGAWVISDAASTLCPTAPAPIYQLLSLMFSNACTHLQRLCVPVNHAALLIVIHGIQKHQVEVIIHVESIIVRVLPEIPLDAVQTSRLGDDLEKPLGVSLTCYIRDSA